MYPFEVEPTGVPVSLATNWIQVVNKQPQSIEPVGWSKSDGTHGVGVHECFRVEECDPGDNGGGVDEEDLLNGMV